MQILKKNRSFHELIKTNRIQISFGMKHHESFYTYVVLLSPSVAAQYRRKGIDITYQQISIDGKSIRN